MRIPVGYNPPRKRPKRSVKMTPSGKAKLKALIEGAFYSAAAVFIGDITNGLETITLDEPWEAILVAVIGILGWLKAELQRDAADEEAGGGNNPNH